ncbi:hypothetical protein PP1_030940 [Pseudonocardia sp. P1]|nr:hypothetical protein Ae707Ps1_6074 [Pseudonocardia sp. Ae707_Ps1]
MEKIAEFRPHCDQLVEMIDTGGGPGANEFNDPVVFTNHLRDDRRAPDLVVRTPCPASGMNTALARPRR